MSDFIWIASFPKSGSTWLRFIVSHLMFDLDDNKGLVREIVPNIHDWTGGLRYPWKGAHAAKTHLAFDNLPSRMRTHSAIYVVRNPLDIVDSAISYLATETDEGKDKIVQEFIQNGSVEPWNRTLGYGAWAENVESWTKKDHAFPRLVLKYEDLLDDPVKGVSDVARFLGADADKDKVRRVVEETGFDSMKRVEQQEINVNAKGVFTDERLFDKKDFQFMRKGKSGGYTDTLSRPQISALKESFAAPMKTFGYV